MQTQTDLAGKVKMILKKVLDIKESEIVPGAKLDESLGIDSTEMVEISVVIKKEFGIPLKDNELKKHIPLTRSWPLSRQRNPAAAVTGRGVGAGINLGVRL